MAQSLIDSIPGLGEALKNLKEGSLDGRHPDETKRFPTLPLDREYVVEITEAEITKSNAGNDGIKMVLVVQPDAGEDQQYVGSKIWHRLYFTGHAFQGQQLGTLLSAAKSDSTGNLAEAAAAINGGRAVVALKAGDDERYPQVRWLNVWDNQALRYSGIKPPTKSGGGAAAAPTVDVASIRAAAAAAAPAAPADPAPQPEAAPAPAPAAPAPAPAPAPSAGGIKLPGVS